MKITRKEREANDQGETVSVINTTGLASPITGRFFLPHFSLHEKGRTALDKNIFFKLKKNCQYVRLLELPWPMLSNGPAAIDVASKGPLTARPGDHLRRRNQPLRFVPRV